MTLTLYNSLTRKKEPFRPLAEGKAGMYVCGITAYDHCHLGHARAAVAFDLLYRYLLSRKFKVTYVRNFTDIDDKIIRRSQESKIPWKELTQTYITEYLRDMESLSVLKPTREPKATDHIQEMIAAIEALIRNQKAYVSKGSVYYAVRAFEGYGKLSHKAIEDLEAGARVEIDETKKDPLDFALWKRSKPGEPKWESPWGSGRPGWHIECSVMATKYLGQPFDIHGGGRDLIFPHHENEIAQAEGACAKPFCRYFLHNGFVNIHAEKMSKSLGNILTIKDVVARHGAETVRYFLLSAHYGSPLDYTEAHLGEARAQLDRFYLLGTRLEKIADSGKPKKPAGLQGIEKELADSLEGLPKKFTEAIEDDLNTPAALGAVFEAVRLLNKYLDGAPSPQTPFAAWAKKEWGKIAAECGEVLGVFQKKPAEYFEEQKGVLSKRADVPVEWIEQKIGERRLARAGKDFQKGDRIREELAAKGVVLKDRPDGTTEWFFKSA